LTGRYRFAPRTITGQISALVVLSVAVALLISFVSAFVLIGMSRRESDAGRPRPPFAIVSGLAAKAASESEIAAIVKNAARTGMAIDWLHGADAKTMLKKSRPLDDKFGPGAEDLPQPLRGPAGQMVVPLSNGDALIFQDPFGERPPPVPRFFAIPAMYVLLVVALCILGLSLYAAHYITAPLSSFAQVAATIGRAPGIQRKIPDRSPIEIIRVARALNDMQDRIKNLLDERTNMLTAISHDLRTPLTRMKLRSEKLTALDGSYVAAKSMLADIARMEQMLAETISYLRDDTKVEEMIAVDLPSILQTQCTELSDLGKAISYHGPARLVCHCRPSAIARAIGNVIDNGLKYGTKTSVLLSALPEGTAQIVITDDGPGLCYSQRLRAFEPFYKADSSRTGATEGFGLGLSITRKIIESHGGSIELSEIVPHGLRVQITLPAQIET
jgi:signal transduction histidine kinase